MQGGIDPGTSLPVAGGARDSCLTGTAEPRARRVCHPSAPSVVLARLLSWRTCSPQCNLSDSRSGQTLNKCLTVSLAREPRRPGSLCGTSRWRAARAPSDLPAVLDAEVVPSDPLAESREQGARCPLAPPASQGTPGRPRCSQAPCCVSASRRELSPRPCGLRPSCLHG